MNANNNVIEYETGGTFIKDCTYSLKYKERVSEMIIALFDDGAEKVIIDKGKDKIKKDIKPYQERAQSFIGLLIKSENGNRAIVIDKLNRLKLSDFKCVYGNIIIPEIFNITSGQSKERGEDDFQESVNKISQEIMEYLSSKFENYKDYSEKKAAFLKSLPEQVKVENSHMEIFYKSSMLRYYIDINEYREVENIELVDLSVKMVTEFKGNVVYKYTGECFFECIDNRAVRVTIIYNEEKISAITSWKNWISESIISNYINGDKSRCCTCYFIYDQGKVFQFLQIDEE